MLIAENISWRANGREGDILRDVSLTLAPGQVTALIGPSGGGKTSLLRCLAMIERATEGRITLNGNVYSFPFQGAEVGAATPVAGFKAPWPMVTAVFQNLFLWPHLTLRENILLPLRQRTDETEAEKGARLDALIQQLNMADFIDRYPNETSGGQRQRAALARAVMLQPKYILLDEITSALDVEQTANVLQLIKELKTAGVGVLLITHHLGFAKAWADSVVFMEGGSVVLEGPPSILWEPKHERLAEFLNMAVLAS